MRIVLFALLLAVWFVAFVAANYFILSRFNLKIDQRLANTFVAVALASVWWIGNVYIKRFVYRA